MPESVMRLAAQFGLVLLLATDALACIGAIEPDLKRMTSQSDLVISGWVMSDVAEPSTSRYATRRHTASISIERVYKGLGETTQAEVSWIEYPGCPRATLVADERALLFLKKGGDSFVFVDEQYGKLGITQWQANTPPKDPLRAIEADLKAAIAKDSGRNLLNDVSLLGSLREPISTRELRDLLPTDDEVLESTVHLALLKLYDYTLLARAGELVESVPEKREFVMPQDEALYVRTTIGSEISGVRDPEQLPVLYRFLSSPNYWLRENAAAAIRQIDPAAAVKHLIGLLTDSNQEVRIQALFALHQAVQPDGDGWVAVNVGGGWKGEPEAIARWQQWWQIEGRAKYDEAAK